MQLFYADAANPLRQQSYDFASDVPRLLEEGYTEISYDTADALGL